MLVRKQKLKVPFCTSKPMEKTVTFPVNLETKAESSFLYFRITEKSVTFLETKAGSFFLYFRITEKSVTFLETKAGSFFLYFRITEKSVTFLETKAGSSFSYLKITRYFSSLQTKAKSKLVLKPVQNLNKVTV
ncbi:hypothetical protein OTU49_011708 [Cherax quadricarinatus]|uniref:Uncharacterized protein n=1 Tax=Cherax quadricarinatus TaxID=27406 RepID=A0AAW0W2P5_CHEQU